jgi:DNA-binding NarL/FixJ family response regulator
VTNQLAEPARPIEVLIVDDHPMVREGLAGVLGRHQMKIVGLAANGRQAVEMYLALRPDVMLLDLRLPDQSGFDVVRTVLKAHPEGRIIISAPRRAMHPSIPPSAWACAGIYSKASTVPRWLTRSAT